MSVKIASLYAELGLTKKRFDKGLKDSKTILRLFVKSKKRYWGSLVLLWLGVAAAAGCCHEKRV